MAGGTGRAWRSLRSRVPSWLFDAVLALVLTVTAELELRSDSDDGYRAGSLGLNTPLVVLPTLPLALRRTYPRAAFLACCAALAVPSIFTAHTVFFWSGFLPLMITLYTVRRWCDGPFSTWSWAIAAAALIATGVHQRVAWSPGNLLFGSLCVSVTAASSGFMRRTAQQRAALADALDRLADEQSAREEAAVQAERSRLALEMHDVVAHAVSLMVLQVGAARMTLEQHGGVAPDQLSAAEATGRQALTELRRSLGVLRELPERGPLQPLPGLRNIDTLVDGFRAAGLDVALQVDDVGPVPALLELSVYRVLQESLTNVLRHAGKVRVTAAVRREGTCVVVEVSNPVGRPGTVQVPSGGHGLRGMRERVALLGGRISAGPGATGFVVRASIPLPEPTA